MLSRNSLSQSLNILASSLFSDLLTPRMSAWWLSVSSVPLQWVHLFPSSHTSLATSSILSAPMLPSSSKPGRLCTPTSSLEELLSSWDWQCSHPGPSLGKGRRLSAGRSILEVWWGRKWPGSINKINQQYRVSSSWTQWHFSWQLAKRFRP